MARRRSRRNPAASHLRDGTTVAISGRNVVITSPYGENYEYDECSSSTIRALYSAKTFSAAQKACNRSGVLRSINPRRRKARKSRGGRLKSRRPSGKKRRWLTSYRENCGGRMNPKRRGRGRKKEIWMKRGHTFKNLCSHWVAPKARARCLRRLRSMNPKRGRKSRRARRNAPISMSDKRALSRILRSHKGRKNRC